MATLTKEIIAAAITGFEAQKKHIDGQIAELRSMLTERPPTKEDPSMPDWVKSPAVKTPKQKRKLSAAGRKAIADAAKKRWALINAEKAKKKQG